MRDAIMANLLALLLLLLVCVIIVKLFRRIFRFTRKEYGSTVCKKVAIIVCSAGLLFFIFSEIRIRVLQRNLPEASPAIRGISGGCTYWRQYSSDGKYLCYERFGTGHRFRPRFHPAVIDVVREDGTERKCITENLKGFSNFRSPKWSPNGQRIAFIYRKTLYAEVLCTIKPDGQDFQQLLDADGLLAPSWSPDGTKIVVRGYSPVKGTLYILQSDGAIVSTVDCGYNLSSRPSWSPDGKNIAFGSDNHVYTCDGNGNNSRRITSLGHLSMVGPGPEWSPDGKKLAFCSDFKTFIYDLDKEKITKLPGREALEIAWSPDGEHVIISYHPENWLTMFLMIRKLVTTLDQNADLIHVNSGRVMKLRGSDRVREAFARWSR